MAGASALHVVVIGVKLLKLLSMVDAIAARARLLVLSPASVHMLSWYLPDCW